MGLTSVVYRLRSDKRQAGGQLDSAREFGLLKKAIAYAQRHRVSVE